MARPSVVISSLKVRGARAVSSRTAWRASAVVFSASWLGKADLNSFKLPLLGLAHVV